MQLKLREWRKCYTKQGFPNSVADWKGGWCQKFYQGVFFYQVAGTLRGVNFIIQTFSKNKNSMTCVHKEFGQNKNGRGAINTAKMKFLLGYNMKINIQRKGSKSLLRAVESTGEIFLGRRRMRTFLTRVTPPYPSPVGETLQSWLVTN